MTNLLVMIQKKSKLHATNTSNNDIFLEGVKPLEKDTPRALTFSIIKDDPLRVFDPAPPRWSQSQRLHLGGAGH